MFISGSIGDLELKRDIIFSIGKYFEKKKDFASSLKYCKEALKILNLLGIKNSEKFINITKKIENIEKDHVEH
jgi:hypothetical protein